MHSTFVSLIVVISVHCAPPSPAPQATATPQATTTPKATKDLAPFDHAALDALLKKFVKDDRVDYAALKSDRKELDAYCDRLAKLPQADLEKMARNDQFAFWVNAYNALTLQTIVDHYPIEAGLKLNFHPANSIRQIDGAWTHRHAVASQQVALDDIENKILRPTYKDPRVHTAINCASRGCPPLRPEAFVGARLDEQLDDNVKKFLADPKRNVFDGEKKKAKLSKIFDWFKDDFGGEEGVLQFVRDHAGDAQKKLLDGVRAKDVEFLDYDWTLNDVK